MGFRSGLGLTLLAASFGLPAHGQDLEDGFTAIRRGDPARAAAIWQTLAQQGDREAEYHLGALYRSGQGVRKDAKRAYALYSRAARAGHAKAQYSLGLCYLNGTGVTADLADAALCCLAVLQSKGIARLANASER